jgi:hypothetical protein
MSQARAPSWTHRRGSVYLFALGACTLVVVAGVTAIRVARGNVISQGVLRDADRASREADAAMQLLTAVLSDDPSGVTWRKEPRFGWELGSLSGAADAGAATTLKITLTDPSDNNLADNQTGRVKAVAIAVSGDVQRTREFLIDPVVANLTCLRYSLIYGSAILGSSKVFQIAGEQARITSAQVNEPRILRIVELGRYTNWDVSAIAGNANYVSSADSLFLPSVDSIIAAFRRNGATDVQLTANLTIDKALISPQSFSLGPANSEGLYLINANGFNVTIRDSRIVASLVIYGLGTKGVLEMSNAVACEPALPGFPTLIVDGTVVMKQKQDDLDEADIKRNLNPIGAPYLNATDSDSTDLYPSMLRGLVYVRGNMEVSGAEAMAMIHGQLFVTGALEVKERFVLRPNLIESTQPIIGFSMPAAVSIVQGSVTGN